MKVIKEDRARREKDCEQIFENKNDIIILYGKVKGIMSINVQQEKEK